MKIDFTPVIFRKFKEGDIIALFPTIPGDLSPSTCESYQHIGQHGAADLSLISVTVPALPEEYKDLLKELQSIGYDDLKIYCRQQYWMYKYKLGEMTLNNYR